MSDAKILGGDDRLKKSSATPARGDRAEADASRTESDGTALTREERRQMMRAEWNQEVLPTPPKNAGWHYCWLSTTNSSDPIYKRVQRGYEPVKVSEVPGFGSQYTSGEGEFEGCVACNEMLLFKVPEDLYQDMMSYFHYELPNGEEELLKANAKEKLSEKDSDGQNLAIVEGFDHLAKKVRQPTFS